MGVDQTSGIVKTVKCTAALATQYLIAKPGADDDTFSQAAAVGDSIVGVFQSTTAAAGDQVDMMVTGISLVAAGGTITRGALVTSDAAGKAIAAAPAAGTNNSIVGRAMKSASSGDEVPVLLSIGSTQG